jgi:hypothetical protein
MPEIKLLITGVSSLPVSVATMKSHLNIASSFTADDTIIQGFIRAATSSAEKFLAFPLAIQTWATFRESWGTFYIDGKNISNVSIDYTDSDGVTDTLSTDVYNVNYQYNPVVISLATDESWPDDELTDINPIKLSYSIGYNVGEEWESSHTYVVGDYVDPGNGLVYRCSVGGDSSTVEPIWNPTIGSNTSDGTVTWVTDSASIPEDIKLAIKVLVTDMYNYRGDKHFNDYDFVNLSTVYPLLLNHTNRSVI